MEVARMKNEHDHDTAKSKAPQPVKSGDPEDVKARKAELSDEQIASIAGGAAIPPPTLDITPPSS
jgi:hypothetical protein